MKAQKYFAACVLLLCLSACMTSAAKEDQRKPAAEATVTEPQVCSNNYVNTQYGCLPQGNCSPGFAEYNHHCFPALQPYSSSGQLSTNCVVLMNSNMGSSAEVTPVKKFSINQGETKTVNNLKTTTNISYLADGRIDIEILSGDMRSHASGIGTVQADLTFRGNGITAGCGVNLN